MANHFVNYSVSDEDWVTEKRRVLELVKTSCDQVCSSSSRIVVTLNDPPYNSEKRWTDLGNDINNAIVSDGYHLLLDIAYSGCNYRDECCIVICPIGKYEKHGTWDSTTFGNPNNFIGFDKRKKCWSIQWLSMYDDMYEQIDTTAIYSTAKSVLTAINEIIQDKKRDIEEDGVRPPREFGVFTEERLNKMNPDSWEMSWKYHDELVIVTARQMF
jgi:hypothetical protein